MFVNDAVNEYFFISTEGVFIFGGGSPPSEWSAYIHEPVQYAVEVPFTS